MGRILDTKRKLRIIQQQGFPQIVTDIVKICDKIILEEDIIGTDEEYGRVSAKVYYKLKGMYKRELQVDDIIPKQRDLEELIHSIKTGKEP